jgi:hypothetical protein
MGNKKKTMEQKMKDAEVIIGNLQQKTFKKSLKPYGYDEDRIQEVGALYEEVRFLMKEKERAYQEQLESTLEFRKQSKIAADYFTKNAVQARHALGNDKKRNRELGIAGRRKKAFSDWTEDAMTFYIATLADPDIMAELKRFGITPETMETGVAMIENIQDLHARKINKKGVAQVMTPRKNKKMKELFKLILDILFCARQAFADRPDMVDQLMTPVVERTEVKEQRAIGWVPGEEKVDSRGVKKKIPLYLPVYKSFYLWRNVVGEKRDKLANAA